MNYPENIVLNELMWEYDYTKSQAQAIIEHYKRIDRYSDLCELIQYRLSVKLTIDDLCHSR